MNSVWETSFPGSHGETSRSVPHKGKKSYLLFLKAVGKTWSTAEQQYFTQIHTEARARSPLVPWAPKCDLCLIRDLRKTEMEQETGSSVLDSQALIDAAWKETAYREAQPLWSFSVFSPQSLKGKARGQGELGGEAGALQ